MDDTYLGDGGVPACFAPADPSRIVVRSERVVQCYLPRFFSLVLGCTFPIRSRRRKMTMRDFVFRGFVEPTTTCRLGLVSERSEGGKENPLGLEVKPTPSRPQTSSTPPPIQPMARDESKDSSSVHERYGRRRFPPRKRDPISLAPRGTIDGGEQVPACPSWIHTHGCQNHSHVKGIHPKHACPASSVYPSNHLQTPNQLRPFPWDLRCHPFAKITTGNPSMTSGPLRAQQPCKSACDGPKDRKMCLSNRILQENHVPERSASQ